MTLSMVLLYLLLPQTRSIDPISPLLSLLDDTDVVDESVDDHQGVEVAMDHS